MRKVLNHRGIEIDAQARRLWRNGQPVALAGRAFDLLVALSSRRGETLSKDELLDRVWGDKSVGDFNLHVQVSQLRKVLGADSIRTVSGRGYCFVDTDPSMSPCSPGDAMAAASGSMSLFGRQEDVRQILQLLGQRRVVVVTGAGGVGKTSVAQVVMERETPRHRDSGAWVDLTSSRDAADLPAAIASALRVGVTGAQSVDALVRGLRPLDTIVLLDNADGLMAKVDELIPRMLKGCPGVRLLVTSQVPSRSPHAYQFRLTPLACPPEGASLAESLGSPAVMLLQDRIQAVDHSFNLGGEQVGAATAICRQLDGIPLAIEMAAARCGVLGLDAVLRQLSERFHWADTSLSRANARQRSPAAMMAWSYALLSPQAQEAFLRLGTCEGGVSLDLARRLLRQDTDAGDGDGEEQLSDLIGQSLVSMDQSRAGQFRLLETARLFALDRLRHQGMEDEHRRRHARATSDHFESAYAEYWQTAEQHFVVEYEPDLDNLRAALRWALANEPELAVALAGASGPLWRALSLQHEAIGFLEQAATLIDAGTALPLSARLWESIALQHGESASLDGREPARNAARIWAQLGDRRGRYVALALFAYSFRYIDTEEAHAAFDEMRRLEDPAWPAAVRLLGARVEAPRDTLQERIREGRAVNELRFALATEAGSIYEENCALVNLADLALMAGDTDAAVRLNRDLLNRLTRRHMASRVIALGNLLEALVMADRLAEALQTGHQFVEEAEQMDFMFGMFAADALGLLAARQERWSAAVHLLGWTDGAYAARHRDRGPNEAALRAQLAAAIQQCVSPSDRELWAARGAALNPKEACLLALAPDLACE